ncbi:MAG: complex I subunit 1 family protein [Cytophagales bacterium]
MILAPLYLGIILLTVVVIFYIERKLPAIIQDRLGPMETGPYGMFQAIADLLKMIQKEDIVPTNSDRILFKLAPFVIMSAVFAAFMVVPLSENLQASYLETGVFFILAVVSLDVLGLLMAGWGSGNKYALMGAMRAISQIISYEIPVGLSVLCVVIATQTLDLQEICIQQKTGVESYFFSIKSEYLQLGNYGGFLNWNIFKYPTLIIAFVVFYIATLAECNRAPFDLPEAESELISGFHSEYSGFRFAIFFLAEYAMMLLVSLMASIFFFGGWNSPIPNIGNLQFNFWTSGGGIPILTDVISIFWLLSKSLLIMTTHVWVRWTFPRLRMDQLMSLCWKYLTPISLVLVLLTAFIKGY